jgi:transcriptional regulator with XRE-family HTH domain
MEEGILKGLDTSGKIKALMAPHKVTQKDLAALLNVTGETISNRLAANRWDVKDLEKIAKKFDIDPGLLL